MINHPNRQPQTYRPRFRAPSKDWGYVISGLDTGQEFVRRDLGYPIPSWSNGHMRVRLAYNDYNDQIWIIEAKVAECSTIPDDCRMV